MMRLIGLGLEGALPGHRIVAYPWVANLKIQYRIHLEFQRFDLYAGGSAELRVSWAFAEGRQGPWRRFGTISLTESFEEGDKPDYPARVAALNRLASEMNRRLAEALRTFLAERPAR